MKLTKAQLVDKVNDFASEIYANKVSIENLICEKESLKTELAAKTEECERYERISDDAIRQLYALARNGPLPPVCAYESSEEESSEEEKTIDESRQAWQDHVYGKCYCCGEGYSKDDWRFQATMFEDENEGVQHLDMVTLFLKNNKSIEEDVDGNGLCCSCAQDTFDDC